MRESSISVLKTWIILQDEGAAVTPRMNEKVDWAEEDSDAQSGKGIDE